MSSFLQLAANYAARNPELLQTVGRRAMEQARKNPELLKQVGTMAMNQAKQNPQLLQGLASSPMSRESKLFKNGLGSVQNSFKRFFGSQAEAQVQAAAQANGASPAETQGVESTLTKVASMSPQGRQLFQEMARKFLGLSGGASKKYRKHKNHHKKTRKTRRRHH